MSYGEDMTSQEHMKSVHQNELTIHEPQEQKD